MCSEQVAKLHLKSGRSPPYIGENSAASTPKIDRHTAGSAPRPRLHTGRRRAPNSPTGKISCMGPAAATEALSRRFCGAGHDGSFTAAPRLGCCQEAWRGDCVCGALLGPVAVPLLLGEVSVRARSGGRLVHVGWASMRSFRDEGSAGNETTVQERPLTKPRKQNARSIEAPKRNTARNTAEQK